MGARKGATPALGKRFASTDTGVPKNSLRRAQRWARGLVAIRDFQVTMGHAFRGPPASSQRREQGDARNMAGRSVACAMLESRCAGARGTMAVRARRETSRQTREKC